MVGGLIYMMSISPKLSNSTPEGKWADRHDRLRIQPAVLRELMDCYEYQLKFVIAAPADLTEVRLVLDTLEADRARVILMPEGTDPAILRERGAWLAEICKDNGFRFSPRRNSAAHRNDESPAGNGGAFVLS